MVPDAREGLEVAALVLGGVVLRQFQDRGVSVGDWGEGDGFLGPEAHGLGGEGLEADKIAWFAVGHFGAGGVEGADAHPEPFDLDLSFIDGGNRARRAEEGDDVRAARDAPKVDRLGKCVVDVSEGARRQGRSGGVDGSERTEVYSGF